jgi:hypothetical protein
VLSSSSPIRETVEIEVELLGEIASNRVGLVARWRRPTPCTRNRCYRRIKFWNLNAELCLQPTCDHHAVASETGFLMAEEQSIRPRESNKIAIDAPWVECFKLGAVRRVKRVGFHLKHYR